ncbi:hypothetical protein KV697_10785 [Sphingomonas sanguinis]|uniref:hypothetical protein n=1 Tax=Sphingomonas sanguinis TaxID=33051 RepID=UPI001C5727D7|nr:hypothetical protein [Sphingomonas sanguinis]QXT34320.1 hypothetical protein KV697_10785 [Sphingomonas sanguinis]
MPLSYKGMFRFRSHMDESEELIAGYFHFMRSQRRKKKAEWTAADARLLRSVQIRAEEERRAALRQARLEWAEDRDAWERQWR